MAFYPDSVNIWLRHNNVDVESSNRYITTSPQTTCVSTSWGFLKITDSNEYYTICWSSTNGHTIMTAYIATTDPSIPASPSINVIIMQVA